MESPLDALIVGTGFGGLYLLHTLRSQGFNVKGVEAGGDIGGVWFWNNYPGARVDSDYYIYQFSSPELFEDFDYTHRFPGRDEVFRYFLHVEKKLDLKRDIQFNTRVTEAEFNGDLWDVKSSSGVTWKCRFLFLCTGALCKPYIPQIKDLESFKGEVYHTSQWPKDRKIEIKGKRVGIIGTGASGVQVIQEVGPLASHLTIFQRTPNAALPMRQCIIPNSKHPGKKEMPGLFSLSKTTFSGIALDNLKQNGCETSPPERRALYEKLWNAGGLAMWLANFQDLLISKEVNDEVYAFWNEKTRPRITNERKRELLAPLIPPHPFGTKQPCLEQTYFEVCDKDNVEVVDVNLTPIHEVTEKGLLRTSDGVTREIDLLILATGYDSLTGTISNIRITNGDGKLLEDKWKEEGTSTLFGMAVAGFPNLFFLYGPQGLSAFTNGPTAAEVQGEWLTRLMVKMRNEGKRRCEVKNEAEEMWQKKLKEAWEATLFPKAKSWYSGANIPGKKKEVLAYAGGLAEYTKLINACEENQFEGFQMV